MGMQQQAGQSQSHNQNPVDSDFAQMRQSGESVGQSGDGVSDATNQQNDHTSAIDQNQQDATGGAIQTGWKTGDTEGQVRHGQSVVDSNGQHVGTVDSLDGDRIKLTRKDSADGHHHYISASEVTAVEGNEVRLGCTANAIAG